MNDSLRQPATPVQESDIKLFREPKEEPARRSLLFGAAGAVVLIAAIAGLVFVHRPPATSAPLNTVLPTQAYAANLAFMQLAMSESESLSGGKSTFLDGRVRNSGGDTLTSITLQALFKNDEGLSPTAETISLSLIRTHAPYVDTEPVSAAPLKPGDEAEFRLIFETVPANWNQQMPELRVIHVTKR